MKCSTVYVLPHPPELFSFYSKTDNAKKSSKTVEAYDCLLDEIVADEPNVIIFVQSLGGIYPQGLTFHIPDDDNYIADYKSFVFAKAGIKVPESFSIPVDKLLAAQLQKSVTEFERKTNIITSPQLPLSILIYLDLYLQKVDKPPKVVVLSVSLESSHKHYEYGSLLSRALASDQESSVVVICGQLSHRLSKEAVAGYMKDAKDYDMDFMNYIETGKLDQFMVIDPFLIDDVAEDLYKPFCTALGLLSAQDGYRFHKYAYEAPHGIGYLSGKINAK